MPLTRLDTDQRKAASTGGHEVVVTAGAGSGKTRLLVGRYLHLLENRAATMNQIAAITFTEKAANQMKVAIAGEARKLAVQEGHDREFWLGIADSVHGAPISTIHGFCNSILRSHPVEGKLDPLFGILDGATVSELTGEAVERFIRARLDAEPDGIERLIRDFGMHGLNGMFRDLLGQRARLATWLDRHGSDDAGELERGYESYLIARMNACRLNLSQFHTLAPGDDSLTGKIGELLPALEVAVSMMEEGRITASVIDDISNTIGAVRGGSKNKWDACGCDVGKVRGSIKDCRDFLGILREYYRRDKGVTAHTAHTLLQEFVLLDRHFLDMKKARSAFDHDDTLIETWRLLRTDAGVLQEVARSFRHIMVDEFQDTDGLQMDILQMVAGNGTAVFFAVGDPKQSIYRFRGADVAIFNEFVNNVSGFIRLKKNYRSDPGIIEFVNRVFSRVMGDEPSTGSGSLESFEAVYSEMKSPVREPVIRPMVDIAVFEHARGEDWRPREAAWIAGKMRELHEIKGLSYSDMALILRKSTWSPVYQEALLELGIPYVDLAGNKPFSGEEARDIATLLEWLCDPRNPAAFTALLLSPLVAAETGHVFALRRIAGAPELMPDVFLTGDGIIDHPWLAGLDAAHVRDTLTHLLAMRDRAPIREVIESAFERTGYTAALLADPVRGELALSVTDMILDTADSFEQNGGGIRDFARLLASGVLDASESAGLESRDDAVNIITIHKAKGLEYRAVFCADICGRPRNDTRPIVIDRDLGIGFTIRDTCGKNVRTIVSAIGQDIEKRKNIAESKRLFYVACTRAKSRLILTGGNPPSTPGGAYDSDNWMEWLHSALELSPAGEFSPGTPAQLFRYERFAGEDAVTRPRPADYWADILAAGESGDTKSIPDPETVSAIAGLTAAKGSPPVFSPAHLSPSQVEDYLACPRLYLYRHVYRIAPPRMTGAGGYGPQYGSFAHGVLERWDFRESPETLIASVNAADPVWTGLLSDQLARFRETRLYQDIVSAGQVSREAPFVFLHGTVMVRGSIDCILELDGVITIIDFKTDRIDFGTAGDLAGKYRLQLALYALAVHRATGKIPGNLVLYFLDPADTVSLPCTDSLLAEAEDAIERTASGIARNDFECQDDEKCGECPYTAMCGK